MTPESPVDVDKIGDEPTHQIVYVLMSENSGGVAGMVCATRQRAEDELRSVLGEYIDHDATGPRASHSPEAIEGMIEESRGSSINPYPDDWYWIDVCPVHT